VVLRLALNCIQTLSIKRLSESILDTDAESFLFFHDMSPHHEDEPFPGSENPFFVSSLDNLHEFEVLFFLLAGLVIDAFNNDHFIVSQFVLLLIIMLPFRVDHHLIDLTLLDGLNILSLSIFVHEVGKNVLHHQELQFFPMIEGFLKDAIYVLQENDSISPDPKLISSL
jgi:hypothetical protein